MISNVIFKQLSMWFQMMGMVGMAIVRLGEQDIETASTSVRTLLIVKWHVLLTLNVKAIPIYQIGHVAMCTLQVNAKADSHLQIIMITLGLSNISTTPGHKVFLNMDVTLNKRVL